MPEPVQHVLYFVSAGALSEDEDPLDSAEFVSENSKAAFAYIETNKLESTHQVFTITSTSNLLTIWTGE